MHTILLLLAILLLLQGNILISSIIYLKVKEIRVLHPKPVDTLRDVSVQNILAQL